MSGAAAPDPAQEALDYLHVQVLRPGESVVWKGRPSPKRVKRREMVNIFGGGLFVAFALFWSVQAVRVEPIMALFGLPFVGIGVFAMMRPWRARKRAEGTYYAITDQRVILLKTDTTGYTVTILEPQDLTDVKARYREGDSGDLRLRRSTRKAPRQGRYRWGQTRTISVVDYMDGLWGVQDLAAAEAAVQRLVSAPSQKV